MRADLSDRNRFFGIKTDWLDVSSSKSLWERRPLGKGVGMHSPSHGGSICRWKRKAAAAWANPTASRAARDATAAQTPSSALRDCTSNKSHFSLKTLPPPLLKDFGNRALRLFTKTALDWSHRCLPIIELNSSFSLVRAGFWWHCKKQGGRCMWELGSTSHHWRRYASLFYQVKSSPPLHRKATKGR